MSNTKWLLTIKYLHNNEKKSLNSLTCFQFKKLEKEVHIRYKSSRSKINNRIEINEIENKKTKKNNKVHS